MGLKDSCLKRFLSDINPYFYIPTEAIYALLGSKQNEPIINKINFPTALLSFSPFQRRLQTMCICECQCQLLQAYGIAIYYLTVK